MRRLIATLAAAVLASSLSVDVGAAASPNPCTIIPPAKITAAFGPSSAGKRTSEPAGKARLGVCTFARGTSKLEVSIGPKVIAEGGYGGPSTVSRADASFGPHGHLAYDTSAPYVYATVFFVKGAYYGSVWSNTVRAQGVITLATALYRQL